ncbi:exodeoxyribonuclease VII large subunit [Atopobacter sp. AH10]|uniref:exodeoxyribonuclease VII large subunit n=1 Tax=Atopobacter sp. AH10 TaxID=2315861 RepID=UPI000EF17966|nr:exodeoxyribonuclease VII large subunit [Atopobacter sp. AH10]RLK62528.1 exodeoxyribonuclease VII large subunit [Atopobacter sp. AH10]
MEKPSLTVSGLTRYLKLKFDKDPYLKEVTLVGEISNFRPRRNGHQYFNLKDDHALIAAMLWSYRYQALKFKLEEGMEVVVKGEVTLYGPQGRYQLLIKEMEPLGEGALFLAFQQLKEKLTKEGLFDRPKRPLPLYPKRLAVITSEHGAVIHDIETTVARRYPLLQIDLYPAAVQGEGADLTIIKQLERIRFTHGYDALIIGRGGGSIEDLWTFNSENLVRALVDFPIPVISSVGHETDTTLVDFVADRRAATPTAAAEMATPYSLTDLLASLREADSRLNRSIKRLLSVYQEGLRNYLERPLFTRSSYLYADKMQDLDRLTDKLHYLSQQKITSLIRPFNDWHRRLELQHPKNRLLQASYTLEERVNQLNQLMKERLKDLNHRFHAKNQALILLNPLAIMEKGYSLVMTPNEELIKSVDDLKKGQEVDVHFHDGIAKAEIISKEKFEEGKD